MDSRPRERIVPKYSALASAESKPVVIIGVWLIFAPMFLSAVGYLIVTWFDAEDIGSLLLAIPFTLLIAGLAAAILWKQTRRFLRYQRTSDE